MKGIQNLFEPSISHSEEWIRDLLEETGWDEPRRAYSTLRAVLHTLRDRLTPHEAADLASHMPMLIRGLYFEGWHAEDRPMRYRQRQEFLDRVQKIFARNQGDELEKAVGAVFRVIERHVPEGEVKKIREQLPKDIRTLWPETVRT